MRPEDTHLGPNPSGLCMCGCGEKVRLATKTRKERGQVQGHPVMFVYGHGVRVRMRENPMRGENHPRWNGGQIVVKGYRKILVGLDHPMSDAGGYAYEHRLVASKSLGRTLARSEHVHHVDGDILNNDPGNLVVVDKHEHRRIHHMIDDKGIDPRVAVNRVVGDRTG